MSDFYQSLRRKYDTTTADPAWHTDQTNPNTFTVTVGGTAADGDYTITVDPENGGSNVDTTFDRAAAEDNTAIGAGLDAALDTNVATDGSLDDYLTTDVSNDTAVVTCQVEQDAPGFRLTFSQPGGATLTASPDDTFPITTQQAEGHSKVILRFRMLNSSGDAVANNTTTADVTVVSYRTDGLARYDSSGARLTVGGNTTDTGHSLVAPLEGDVPSGDYFTVHLSALTSPPGTIDSVEVMWKPA